MKKHGRHSLALHRETLRRLEQPAPAFRTVAGGRPRTTSDGDICSDSPNCMTMSGAGYACTTIPMVSLPEAEG